MTRENVKVIIALDTLFIFILALSGAIESTFLSEAVYYLAFILPISLGIAYIHKNKREKADEEDHSHKNILPKKDKLLFSMPLIFPSIALTLLISYLTTLLLGAFGYENPTVIEESFFPAVLLHALIPAVFEELLFRYVPIKLLGKSRGAILISSFAFAFAHVNLFMIPYATFAGVVLAFLYVYSGSILPSIILHFMNNLISLISIFGYGGTWLIPAIIVLAILSTVFIIIVRKRYAAPIKELKESDKANYLSYLLMFALGSLVLSISSLFAM